MLLNALISIVEKILDPIIEYFREGFKQNREIIVRHGDKIALKTFSGGRYVQANGEVPTGDLIARGPKVDAWENFEIVASETPFSYKKNIFIHYGDRIALRACSNNHFVGVNYGDHQHVLTSFVDHVREWETFILVAPPNNSKAKNKDALRYGDLVALKADRSEYVMSHKEKDGILLAIAHKIDDWETFIVIDPRNPK